MNPQEAFRKEIAASLENPDARNSAASALKAMDLRRQEAVSVFANLDLARSRAAYTRWKVTENLDKYLVDFEANVIRRGGKVVWAFDAANAIQEIDQILKRTGAKRVVSNHHPLAEEIGLPEHLKSKNFQRFETDFGTYLLNLQGSKRFHPGWPTLRENQEAITKNLNKAIRSSLEADQEELVSDLRAEMRAGFMQAELAITGSNFLIADHGAVAISENEGGARLGFAFAKTQVILAGIDQVLPTLSDLELFFTLFSTHATGQRTATYNTITGPVARDEKEGPSEFVVILLDNGRSSLLATQDQRQALTCIQCGACNNVCPVFELAGGEAAYQSYRGGPAGQVSGTLQQGMDEFKYLSQASTLCGRCTQVCPVRIDLHNHLVRNRHEGVLQGHEKTGEKFSWFTWKKFMLSRKNMNRQVSLRNFTLKQFFRTDWGEERVFPKIADKSFNQRWREMHNLD